MIKRLILCFTVFISSLPILQAQSSGSYFHLKGTIDKFPVALHLHKAGHYYTGYYYYTITEQPVYVTGNDTAAGDGKIRLLAFVPGDDDNEIFTLENTTSGYAGEWQKNADSKPLKVKLISVIDKLLQFDYVFESGAINLRPGMQQSPAADFEVASVWPKGETTTAAVLKKLISGFYNEKSNSADISKIFEAQKKDFLDGYVKDNKAVPDSEIVAFPGGYNLTENQYVGICYQSNKLLSLYSFVYSYTGGAHGNYGTTYTSVNLANGSTIQLEDVLLQGNKSKLNVLLEKYFRKSRGLKPGASLSEEGGLFENKIETNENFYVTGKGIVFSYTPYEIAPYAAGEIQVFIPFSDMKNILQPAFKKDFL